MIPLNIEIHNRSLTSCLGTGTSIKKSGGIKLVLWAQTYFILKRSLNDPHISKIHIHVFGWYTIMSPLRMKGDILF